MTRFRAAGALTAGLLIVGVMAPAVASAATPTAGAAEHLRAAGIAQHTPTAGIAGHSAAARATAHSAAAGTTEPSSARPVPIGTPISLTVIGSQLQLLPSLLGVTNTSPYAHR